VEATVLNLDCTFAEVLRRAPMSSRSASRSKARAAMRWWLGPVIAYLCMLAAMLLFGLVTTPFEISADVLTVVEQWIVYSIPLIIIYLHIRRVERRKKFWQSVGVHKKNMGQSIIWVFALFVIFTGIMAVYWQVATSAMGEDPRDAVDEHFETFPDWYFAYMFLASFFPVALSEELVFRGFTLDRFLTRGAIFAIVASSAMFASLHLWYAGFGLLALPLYGWVFLLATYWGIVYWKTRNIVGLVIIHGLNNVSLSVGCFFGGGAVNMMTSAMFIVGMACLGYLLIKYIRGVFREIEILVRGR